MASKKKRKTRKKPENRRAKRAVASGPKTKASLPDLSQWPRLTPGISLADALASASRRSGRSIAEVCSATYVSAMELEAVLAERPTAAKAVRRFESHWRILFAKREGFVDLGHGPAYVFTLEPTDDLLVFEDGSVMTRVEETKGS